MSEGGAKTEQVKQRIDQFYRQLAKRSYFDLLGVHEDTAAEDLKNAYHALAKRWHTDAFTGMELGPEQKKLDEIFQTIGEAYATLSDAKKRAEYVVRLHRQQQGLSNDINGILRAEQLVDEAVALTRRRDWAQAKSKLEEAIRLNKDDALYVVHLAWVNYHHGRATEKAAEQSIEMLKNAAKRQENLPLAYQHLGQIYFALERFEEAKKWWKKCLEWEPGNVESARGIRLMGTRQEKQKKGLGSFINKLFGK